MKLDISQNGDMFEYRLDGNLVASDSALWSYDTSAKLSKAMAPDIIQIFNGDGGEICFDGSQEKFNLIQPFLPHESDIEILFIEKKELLAPHFEEKMDAWFSELLSSYELNDVQKIRFQQRIADAKNHDINVNILGSQKSGKSTLINAILRKNVLRVEDNSAKTVQIVDNDQSLKFKMIGMNTDHIPVFSVNSFSDKAWKKIAIDDDISSIRIEGDIPFVSSNDYSLSLFDIPESADLVNNQQRSLTVDQQGVKQLILYVIPANQDEIILTDPLIQLIRSRMRSEIEKAVTNRFVFIITKTDATTQNKLEITERIKHQLADIGIEESTVIAVSAKPFVDANFNKDLLTKSGIGKLEAFLLQYIEQNVIPDRLERLENLAQSFLIELNSSDDSVEKRLNLKFDQLQTVREKLINFNSRLDEPGKQIRKNRISKINEVKQILSSEITSVMGSLSGKVSQILSVYESSELGDRKKELTEVVDSITQITMQKLAEIHRQIEQFGGEINVDFSNLKIETGNTAGFLRENLNQVINSIDGDDNSINLNSKQQTISRLKEFYQEFQNSSFQIIQRQVEHQLDISKNNIGDDLKTLTDNQQEQQREIDTLMKKKTGLEKEVTKLKMLSDLVKKLPKRRIGVKA